MTFFKQCKYFCSTHFGEYIFAGLFFFVLTLLFLGIPWRILQGSGVAFVASDTVSYFAPYRGQILQETNQQPTVHNSIIADNMMVYYPSYWHMYEQLTQGATTTYNPYSFAGRATGSIGGGSFVMLSLPLFFAHVLGEFSYVFTFEALQNLTLAGLGMYVLLRWWRLQPTTALLGSVVWMFAQHQVVWLQFPAHLRAQLWIPILLLLFERAFYKPTLWRLATFGTTLGFVWTVGYTQITSYLLLFFGVYFWFLVYLTYGKKIKTMSAVKKQKFFTKIQALLPISWRVIGFAITIFLFLGLGGMTVLSQATSISTSIRGQQVGEHTPPCMMCSVQGVAESIILFVQPNLLGDHVRHPYNGFKNLVETGRYMTWLPFFSMAAGLWITWRNPKLLLSLSPLQRSKAIFFTGFAVFVFLLMQGFPGITHAFYAIPYLNIGQATRMITLVLFCSILATAIWFDSVLVWIQQVTFGKKARKRVIALSGAVGLVVGFLGSWLSIDSAGDPTVALDMMYSFVQWWFPFMTDADARFFLFQALSIPILFFVYVVWISRWRGVKKKAVFRFGSFSILQKSVFKSILIGIIFFELLIFQYAFHSFARPEMVLPANDLTQWLQQQTKENRILPSGSIYLPNTHAVLNLKSIAGYGTGIPVWYMNWISDSFSSYETTYNGYVTLAPESNDMANQLATKYVLVEANNNATQAKNGQEAKEIHDLEYVTTLSKVHIYKNTQAWPRLWWTPELCDVEQCQLVYNPDTDIDIEATWYQDGFESRFTTDTEGTLVVANIYSPNWHLTQVPNEHTSLQPEYASFPVNTHITGFMLPAQTHELSLQYSSRSMLTVVRPVLLIIICIWAIIRLYIRRDIESVLFGIGVLLFLLSVFVPYGLPARMPEF